MLRVAKGDIIRVCSDELIGNFMSRFLPYIAEPKTVKYTSVWVYGLIMMCRAGSDSHHSTFGYERAVGEGVVFHCLPPQGDYGKCQ